MGKIAGVKLGSFLTIVAMVGLVGASGTPPAQAAETPPPALSLRDGDALWKQLAGVPAPGPLPTNAEPAVVQAERSRAGDLADLARAFYQTHAAHPKAPEAMRLERLWLERAIALGDSNRLAQLQFNPHRTEEEQFQERLNQMQKQALLKGGSNPAAVMAEIERQARALLREDPKRKEAHHLLMTVAQNSHTNKMAAMFRELIGMKSAPEELRAAASTQLRQLEKIGHPFELEFKDVRGREFQITNALGRNVVLAFFRATIPGEIKTIQEIQSELVQYSRPDEKHPPLLVGVSLDEQIDLLTQIILHEKWEFPIQCDGRGWGNAISLRNDIMRTPTIYLIDRKGILRFMDAREDLASKLRMLQWEK